MSRTLSDSEMLRRNVVDGQIRPHCVLNEALMEALLAIPREHFAPKAMWHACYTDKDLEIAPGRVMLPSVALAHILLSVHQYAHEIAVLGCGYGYLLALLSYYLPNAEIVGYESIVSCYKNAQEQLTKYGNVSLKYHSLLQPFDINQQFDYIIYDGGSVPKVFQDHLSYLKPEGKIIFVGGDHYPMISNLNVVGKNSELIKSIPLDINLAPLHELVAQDAFIF